MNLIPSLVPDLPIPVRNPRRDRAKDKVGAGGKVGWIKEAGSKVAGTSSGGVGSSGTTYGSVADRVKTSGNKDNSGPTTTTEPEVTSAANALTTAPMGTTLATVLPPSSPSLKSEATLAEKKQIPSGRVSSVKEGVKSARERKNNHSTVNNSAAKAELAIVDAPITETNDMNTGNSLQPHTTSVVTMPDYSPFPAPLPYTMHLQQLHPSTEEVSDYMGCNSCTHPTCMHSSAQLKICECPGEYTMGQECTGSLILDVNSKPNWKLACNKLHCNTLIRFRGDIHNISPQPSKPCNECGIITALFEFNKLRSPLPDGATSCVGCVRCDEFLNSITEVVAGRVKNLRLVRQERYKRGGMAGGRGRGRGGRGRVRDVKMSFSEF
jgi:hypothetical protein